MLKRTNLILPIVLFVTASSIPVLAGSTGASVPVDFQPRAAFVAVGNTDREQDGLVGPVRRVRTETAKIASKQGQPVEGQRTVLETATYDLKGAKIDNAYFLASGGSLTGREEYKYDDRGNIVEMTLRNGDGSIMSKETYAYEFDAMGNWTKMTTSVGVVEGGRLTFEPTEVTYRSIAYYMEENVAKLVQNPAATNATPAVVPVASKPNNAASTTANTNVAAASAQSNVAPKKTAAVVPPSAMASNRTGIVGASIGGQANAAANLSATGAPAVKIEEEAPSSAPKPKAPVKPISGGILNGKATSLPMPLYPDMAKRTRTVGLVSVEVVIDLTGKVISAKATSGPSLLHTAAENAARQARFSPTLLSGQPVKVSGTISYNFSLAQK